MAQDPIDTLRRSAYPNPERRGCPSATTFEALKRREVDVDDPVWTHIERCSECYRQFATIREGLFQEERRSDVKRLMPVAASVAALLLVVVGIYIFRHSGRSEHQQIVAVNRVDTVVLNLEDMTEERGIDVNDRDPVKPRVAHLPRKLVNLSVHLPLGSLAGAYEFEIVSSEHKSVWHAEGRASIKDGVTTVEIAGDLRSVSAGRYAFRFRQANESWREAALDCI